jgi:hypothetical protein
MKQLYFLIFFAFTVASSGYEFLFKKVASDYTERPQLETTSITKLKERLDLQSVESKKEKYVYDEKNNAAACVQLHGKRYQIAYCCSDKVGYVPTSDVKDDPVLISVNGDFLIKLMRTGHGYELSFVDISAIGSAVNFSFSPINFSQESAKKIWGEFKKVDPTFPVPDCKIGNNPGEFYFFKNKQIYLLTIKIPSLPDETKRQAEKTWAEFFIKKAVLIGGVLVITLLLIIFKGTIVSFLKKLTEMKNNE